MVSQREFDNLSNYLPEWSASMLDRVFLLLEAQETAVKNAPESPLVSLIAQCIAFFFQSTPRGDAIRVKAEVDCISVVEFVVIPVVVMITRVVVAVKVTKVVPVISVSSNDKRSSRSSSK